MAAASFDASSAVLKGYDAMVKALSQPTSDIESLSAVKEFIAGVADKIKDAQARHEASAPLFAALEAAAFLPSKEQFDTQWKAAAGAIKVYKKVAEVERALDAEKIAYAEALAAEQLDFEEEISTLAERCTALNRFNKLADCADAAHECAAIKAAIAAADDKARLFNSRESLFGKDLTEYDRVTDIKKAFEPYLTLWESAQSWKTQHGAWMSAPFVSLDAETIEREAGAIARAMFKSTKTFERLAMDGCTAVARAIKEECEAFTPLIPLITALRNPGMRTRHWAELSDAMGTGVRVDPDAEGDVEGDADVHALAERDCDEDDDAERVATFVAVAPCGDNRAQHQAVAQFCEVAQIVEGVGGVADRDPPGVDQFGAR
jgi:dynein heavy chain